MSNVRSLFYKPLDRAINGVVKADQQDTATIFQELDEYVITRELENHFKKFFDAYNSNANDSNIANMIGVWISGFFGSGKSHFLKILSYLLALPSKLLNFLMNIKSKMKTYATISNRQYTTVLMLFCSISIVKPMPMPPKAMRF